VPRVVFPVTPHCHTTLQAVNEANDMLEEEQAADNAVKEINVVLKENNAGVTFAVLQKHRKLLEFPPLADAPHKYQASLAEDSVVRPAFVFGCLLN
jgi:hypothetical protein